ncbi:hypothetical protein SAMN05216324_101475 [Chryseobacterium limigenitum]|uniref:Uncharacterized protein n=2 Tax=Chryseobacterium limigenitum TaxID=1612149 RepID=A0A1K2IEM2_9FLAO|nr:hypothetical protein SAMN05216324_101475 [Chryseobacterium limigenitum]
MFLTAKVRYLYNNIQITLIMEINRNIANNNFKIIGDWNINSRLLKNKFSQLTDFDLKFDEGKEIDLLDRMGNRLRKNREEVMDIIKEVNLS